MPTLKTLLPAYRRHKASRQAVVTLDGRDFYLGRFNSAASRTEYNRLVTEWTANNRTLPTPAGDFTVAELLAGFMRHAKQHYVVGRAASAYARRQSRGINAPYFACEAPGPQF